MPIGHRHLRRGLSATSAEKMQDRAASRTRLEPNRNVFTGMSVTYGMFLVVHLVKRSDRPKSRTPWLQQKQKDSYQCSDLYEDINRHMTRKGLVRSRFACFQDCFENDAQRQLVHMRLKSAADFKFLSAVERIGLGDAERQRMSTRFREGDSESPGHASTE